MSIEPHPTPEDRLRALAAGQASVLESMAQMQAGTLERSGLDRETYLLVRLAALVATDAAPVSYRAQLGAAGGPGLPVARIIGVLGAIAPLVGGARVLSAASKLDLAGLLLPAEPPRITPSG